MSVEERIVKAVQSVKDGLVCSICLEIFKEPVTIKCGHKFCKNCIQTVVKNDKATCPNCNIKINKRAVPLEGNKLLQSCVDNYHVLVQAILDDSGIDTTQPYSQPKHTKESVTNNEKSNISRFEASSVKSFCSSAVNKKQSGKADFQHPPKKTRLSLNKKVSNNDTAKSSNSPQNTLHKYLSNKSNVNDPIQSDEKVKCWLQELSPTLDEPAIDSDLECNLNFDLKRNTYGQPINLEKSPFTKLREEYETSLDNTGDNKSVNETTEKISKGSSETKLKETQKQKQEDEMMARKKKVTPNNSELLLKTPSSVPALSHSDAGDWRRVKKIGKEMQVKTFKSLHVSKEKNSSAAADDIVPCNLANNSRNVFKESDAKNSPSETNAKESKRIKTSTNDSSRTKKSPQVLIQAHKNQSADSTASLNEDMSLTCMDEIKMNEIIGIDSKQNVPSTSEKTKGTSNKTTSNTSPNLLKVDAESCESENKNLDDQLLNTRTSSNLSSSPTKHKLSLKLKLQTPASSKSSSSQKTSNQTQTTNKTVESPIQSSPERSKSRLSLKLPNKTTASPVKKILSPVKKVQANVKTFKSFKVAEVQNNRITPFKKLGKFTKNKKKYPFLYLGKLAPKEILTISSNKASLIKIKSVEPVNIEYRIINELVNENKVEESKNCKEVKTISPEKDSQLKYLTLDSPNRKLKKNVNIDDNLDVNKSIASKSKPSIKVKETDQQIFRNTRSRKHLLTEEDKDIIQSSIDSGNDNKSYQSKSSRSSQKTVIEMKVTADVHAPNQVSSQSDVEIEKSPTPMEICNNNDKDRDELIKILEDTPDGSEITNISINSSLTDDNEVKKSNPCEKPSDKSTSKIVTENLEQPEVEAMVTDLTKDDEKAMSPTCSSESITMRRSSSKKKRTLSISSSEEDPDDNDVSSIIDKWCGAQPAVKKAKVTSDSVCSTEDYINIEDDEPSIIEPQQDQPINDIIDKVKGSRELDSRKLNVLPSSLHSADLFETNEQSVIAQRFDNDKSSEKKIIDKGSLADLSPSKNSDKENFQGKNVEDVTLLDKKQFERNNSNVSENSDGSNKENDEISKDCVSKSRNDQYLVRDSLINMTQEQVDLKRVEKALIGIDLSNPQFESEKDEEIVAATPHKKGKSSNDDDFDTDNIDATPIAKKKQYNFPAISNPAAFDSPILSPEERRNVIPAITPMRNRKSYPLCHSTPMSVTSPTKEPAKSRNITLVCSSLSTENINVVKSFAKKFNAKFSNNFTMDVTHVIVSTDPETKSAPKTSKYIQGIAFRKYVISFQWIIDCIKQNTLLDEDDENYIVLDPENLEPGSKKSRDRIKNLYDGFAFYCVRPFNSMSLDDFENILKFNGGDVKSGIKEVSMLKKKIKLIILDSEVERDEHDLEMLKKSELVLVFFEWVVDSISAYNILSLAPYLCETTVEEALSLGIPEEYLTSEEEED